jgi:uncharacterized lipoprotein
MSLFKRINISLFGFIKLSVLSALIFDLTGCGFFRDREFDYAREDVKEHTNILIPKSVSEQPNIQPYLPVPADGPSSYSPEKIEVAEESTLPPGYAANYNTAFIKQQQDAQTVNSSLTFNDENVGIIQLDTGFNKSWEMVDEALLNIAGFIVDDKNRTNEVFYVSDRLSNEKLDVYVKPDQDDITTTVAVFSQDKAASSDLAHSLLEQVHAEVVANSKVMLDISKLPSKIIKNEANNTSILVIYDAIDVTWPQIGNAVTEAGYTILEKDLNRSYTIQKNGQQAYSLYIYGQKYVGDTFSDLTNISTGFKDITSETRVEAFKSGGQVLPPSQAREIFVDIQNNLKQ